MKREFKVSKQLFSFFRDSLKWLNGITQCDDNKFTSVLKVLRKIFVVYETRGKLECIRYTKGLRLQMIKYLFSLSGDGVNPFLPKILKPFKSYINDKDIDYPLARLILSCLYITRFIRLKPKPSHKSITQSPGYTGSSELLRNDIVKFLKDLGISGNQIGRVPKSLRFKNFHMTSKSGPNGHALWTSYLDAMSLPDDLKESIDYLSNGKLGDLISRFIGLYLRIPTFFDNLTPCKGGTKIRRISVISDKEGKSREVAILDYWSQAALKPLHSRIFRLLSTINQDCTHNQVKHLCNLELASHSRFHSIDLTTATDRFPIAIEREILDVWFGREYADHWHKIMVKYPFEFEGSYLKYETGNPMGAYSSFATFALSHHFFIWLACKRAKKNWKRCPYMLLGDDIVIADDTVAIAYKELLIEWDIPYSREKTHESKIGYEFAKQIIVNNRNISPFPLAALHERRNSPIESAGIIYREVLLKNWGSNMSSTLKRYFLVCLRWSRSRYRSFQPGLDLVISLLGFLQRNEDLGKPLQDYVASTTGKTPKWTAMSRTMYSQYIAGEVLTTTFQKAVSRVTDYDSNKLPLGVLAERMVMNITSLRDGGMDCFDLIEAVPFLQVYGRAEEKYLELSKPTLGARLLRDGTMFRSQLGKVDIPLSDRDFYIRRRDVIIVQALRASREIGYLVNDHIRRNPNYFINPIGPLTQLGRK